MIALALAIFSFSLAYVLRDNLWYFFAIRRQLVIATDLLAKSQENCKELLAYIKKLQEMLDKASDRKVN